VLSVSLKCHAKSPLQTRLGALNRPRCWAVGAALVLLLSQAPAAWAAYAVTALSGPKGWAYGLNGSGQVVGLANGQATLWSGGTSTDLGTLGGPTSIAYSINNAGQIAGVAYDAGLNRRAALWAGGPANDLGTLAGGSFAAAQSINDLGQVVGFSGLAANPLAFSATLWSGGVATDLGGLGGLGTASLAQGINNAGQVVGVSDTAGSGGYHAALWSAGSITDLGTLGGNNSWAFGINESGLAVGWGELMDYVTYHATVWGPGGTTTDLGTLAGGNLSQAYAVNNVGDVVGFSNLDPTSTLTYATLWSAGTVINLNDYLAANEQANGWVLTAALAINDQGWIIANADNLFTGETMAYLFMVPEPSALVLVLAALLALGLRAVQARKASPAAASVA
jgi:probable HAF family extracellular repeat protein